MRRKSKSGGISDRNGKRVEEVDWDMVEGGNVRQMIELLAIRDPSARTRSWDD